MRPVVHGLEQRYGDRVAFAGVNYNNRANRELVQQYRVVGHPTFVVVNAGGEVVGQFVGYTPEADLEAALKRAVGQSGSRAVGQ